MCVKLYFQIRIPVSCKCLIYPGLMHQEAQLYRSFPVTEYAILKQNDQLVVLFLLAYINQTWEILFVKGKLHLFSKINNTAKSLSEKNIFSAFILLLIV